jgi:HEAT repeat protein
MPVRRNAAYVLSRLPSPQRRVIDRELKALAEEPEAEVRNLIAHGLALRQTPDRSLLPAWTYTLRRSRNAQVRAETLHQLENQELTLEQWGPSLWRAVKDEEADIRLEAVQWIGRAGPEAKPAVSYLLAAVSDTDVRVRRAALSALKRSGSRRHEGLQLLGKAQRDPDPLVRCLATEELLELKSADRVAIPLLINDLKGEDDSARCATEALGLAGHFNEDVVPALITVLGEKDPLVRSRAALILMQLGARAREAIPALTLAQKDGIPDADNALKVIRESLPRSQRSRHKKS